MEALVLKCTCKHEFQDSVYGKQMRVHSTRQKDKHDKLAYCTVCSPNTQRNKCIKTVEIKDGKAFGMTYAMEAKGSRQGKPY